MSSKEEIKAIYKFGNLYDQTSFKRILIDDGANISIIVDKNDLLKKDPNLQPEKVLNSEEKENEIKAFISKKGGKYWKLFKAEKSLYFGISASVKRQNGKEQFHFVFQLKLLEDLYIFNKKPEPKHARFFKCHCLVEKCIDDFKFFEPMYVMSLNDAYTKTFELYFAMSGKSTTNAFTRFSESPDIRIPIQSLTVSIQKKGSS